MANSQTKKQIRIASKLVATVFLLLVLVTSQANAWWFFSPVADDQQQKLTTNSPAPSSPPQTALGYGQQQQQQAATVSTSQGQEIKAVAQFDLDGVRGEFKFSQRSPKEATKVEYDLKGLRGNNKLYHVHVRPVPQHNHDNVKQNSSLIGQLCADTATGGHLNPHKITQKLPPKSAPFDKYEIGDLSGKHGPLLELTGQPDHYVGTYEDDKLPMSGEHSIVGRSIVIHKNDGARWVCASIVPVSST